jgi:putative mRNA 3-end processing factor
MSPLSGELILAPPSIVETQLIARLGEYKTAFASGWMQGSSRFYSHSYDHGFVISDHADWDDLNRTIDETGAKQIFVLHRNGALVRHLRKRGLDAQPVSELTLENFQRRGETNLSFNLASSPPGRRL